MDKKQRNILMFWTLWLLAATLFIYVLSKIDFILLPLKAIMSSLFAPLLISGFLFYLLDPLVRLLEKMKIKRTLGIVLVMLLLFGSLVFFILRGIPLLVDQASALISGIPDFIKELEQYAGKLAEEPWMEQIDFETTLNSLGNWMRTTGNGWLENMAKGIGGVISKLTGTAFLLITIPFILFYLLYDGWRFPQVAASLFPESYRSNIKELLKRVNQTISGYISGKGTASLIVGILVYIGYTFLKLPSALLLALFAGITNFIPYVGPFIGAAPAVLLALTISPGKALLVAVIVIVVQQGDGNLFTPMFVGKTLSIHPLTVMLVLLAAGNLAGLVGMLIGVPVFAILKTIVVFIFEVRNQKKRTNGIDHENNGAEDI